jgi:UDP-N-acetylglucosamine transferase subunit ALG13
MGALPPSEDDRRLVVVSVGTDHHPFDRLVLWADLWALEHPQDRVVVQYGTARAPHWAEGHQVVDHAQLLRWFAQADVAVVSCGPGAVMECRRAGRIPVVVPRHRSSGEAVDDHQSAFARHLSRQGLAVTAVDEPRLRSWLAAPPPLLDPRARPAATVPAGAVRVGQLVDQMVWSS